MHIHACELFISISRCCDIYLRFKNFIFGPYHIKYEKVVYPQWTVFQFLLKRIWKKSNESLIGTLVFYLWAQKDFMKSTQVQRGKGYVNAIQISRNLVKTFSHDIKDPSSCTAASLDKMLSCRITITQDIMCYLRLGAEMKCKIFNNHPHIF